MEFPVSHPTPHAAKSPELPERWPDGIRAAATRVGIRELPGDDLALLVVDPDATIAAGARTATAPL